MRALVRTAGFTGDETDEYSYPMHMSGYASTLPNEGTRDDAAEEVRKVAEEVIGKPLQRPERARMGFL